MDKKAKEMSLDILANAVSIFSTGILHNDQRTFDSCLIEAMYENAKNALTTPEQDPNNTANDERRSWPEPVAEPGRAYQIPPTDLTFEEAHFGSYLLDKKVLEDLQVAISKARAELAEAESKKIRPAG